jgi:nitrite reductase/ring-hydroxylating ferredoxin subunit
MLDQDFVKVSQVADIEPGTKKKVDLGNGEEVCIANVSGKLYAISNECTHQQGSLADGSLNGFEIKCPMHGSRFDLRTGEVIHGPARDPVPIYELKIDGNDIFIKKQRSN